MKIDRLYAITIYLLNHGRTSAANLAGHFDVSVRTIQRDIDALCCAGMPIAAVNGASGGYELTDTFQMNRHVAEKDDYSYILTALKGLATATNDPAVNAVFEKIASLKPVEDSGMILDFSALREGDEKLLQALGQAAVNKRPVTFVYTNNKNETREHTVEPVAVVYRWYAWYLLAYSRVKRDYRIYKLVRMSDFRTVEGEFTAVHEPASVILRELERNDDQVCIDVTIRCKEAAKVRALEYLQARAERKLEGGDTLMTFQAVENEHFWFGALLSMGADVEVLEPETLRRRVADAAGELAALYRGE